MMQIGILAIVAANHENCSLQIHNGEATLCAGEPTERKSFKCNIRDDDYINQLIAFLNFGTEVEENGGKYDEV